MKRLVAGALLCLAVGSAGCIFRRADVAPIEPQGRSRAVESPIKVHLNDGRVAIFSHGARLSDTHIIGTGRIYGLDLAAPDPVYEIARDDVAAVEVFDTRYLTGESVAASLGLTAVVVVGVPLLAVAIFGSCPTVYGEEDGALALESELFPNSIAPMFEKRDVNLLNVKPDAQGRLRLEVRNEALETHYINHLELLAVTHSTDVSVVPDQRGRALLVRDLATASGARDASGRDVHAVLATDDGRSFASADAAFEDRGTSYPRDHIDLSFAPPGVEDVVLRLRLRNSLFSSILFYDFLLASQGVAAIDWLGRDLSTVSAAVELGSFFQTHMGLRVLMEEDDEYQEVGRVREVGPIAWTDTAIRLKANPDDSLRLRLDFVSDAWRIDEVVVAAEVEAPSELRVPLSRYLDRHNDSRDELADRLRDADDSYLVTYPGDVFTAEFDIPPFEKGRTTSLLLAGQGFYVEWLRPEWIERDSDGGPDLSEDMIAAALLRWRETRDDFEQRFHDSRIPVR